MGKFRILAFVWMAVYLIASWEWVPAVHPMAVAVPRPEPKAVEHAGAREILGRVAATYANARSYRDTGVVRITWSGELSHASQRPFRTAFVRGGGFRFEFADQEPRSLLGMVGFPETHLVIWGDNDRAKTWWTLNDGEVKDTDLDLAVWGAKGVSGGSSHLVPRLLLPGTISGESIDALEDPRVAAIETVDGRRCVRLNGTHGGGLVDFWIDDHSLLRRVRKIRKENAGQVEEITAYEPSIDVGIAPATFVFEPPEMVSQSLRILAFWALAAVPVLGLTVGAYLSYRRRAPRALDQAERGARERDNGLFMIAMGGYLMVQALNTGGRPRHALTLLLAIPFVIWGAITYWKARRRPDGSKGP